MRVHTLQYIDVQVSRLLEKHSRSFASSSSHSIPSSETPANAIQMPDPNPYSYTSFSCFSTPPHPHTISRPTSTFLFPTPRSSPPRVFLIRKSPSSTFPYPRRSPPVRLTRHILNILQLTPHLHQTVPNHSRVQSQRPSHGVLCSGTRIEA